MTIGILLGLLLATLGIGWYGFERQAQVYRQLVGILEQQRDEARHEAKVFRRLVLPVYDKAESSLASTNVNSAAITSPQPVGGVLSVAASPLAENSVHSSPPQNPLLDRRVPFRIRFKQMSRATNTKQKATDTLATALASQKTQDAKSFVEANSNA